MNELYWVSICAIDPETDESLGNIGLVITYAPDADTATRHALSFTPGYAELETMCLVLEESDREFIKDEDLDRLIDPKDDFLKVHAVGMLLS